MEVFQPFFETIGSAVIAGAEEFRIVSQKPLGHAEISVQVRDAGGWRELKQHPELNSWITHSRLRIVMRMDIADQVTPKMNGQLPLSDGKQSWTFDATLEQSECEEIFTFREASKN